MRSRNQKGGPRGPPSSSTTVRPRRSAKAPPEPSKLLLLGFLCLLGLLRCLLLRFLSHSILFGLMDGNATPRPARGGLASQQPQLSSEQIRSPLSRGVT